jgi:hypothetical protein
MGAPRRDIMACAQSPKPETARPALPARDRAPCLAASKKHAGRSVAELATAGGRILRCPCGTSLRTRRLPAAVICRMPCRCGISDESVGPARVTNPRAQDRRRRDLITTFLSALAPFEVNDLTQVMVRRAAELTVAAEVVRAGMLTGNQNDIAGLIKLENAARRAVLALGLKIEAPKTPRGLRFARERWAEQAKQARRAKAAAIEPNMTESPDQ